MEAYQEHIYEILFLNAGLLMATTDLHVSYTPTWLSAKTLLCFVTESPCIVYIVVCVFQVDILPSV